MTKKTDWKEVALAREKECRNILGDDAVQAIRAHVEGEVKINKQMWHDEYDEVTINGKTIRILEYIPREMSPQGSYEPPWGPNLEALEMYVLCDYELDDDGYDAAKDFANALALSHIKHRVFSYSRRFGDNVQYATYSDCTLDEFWEALDAIPED